MTDTFYPDVSQYTPVSTAGAPIVIARATISNVKDTQWDTFVRDAASHGTPLYGYCFLNHDALGVSAEAQADFAFSVVGNRPVMLDHEPNRNYCATLSMSTRWIDRFRSHGGVVNIDYLPHWAWQGSLGSPDLAPLRQRGMTLVSSNYTTYSDTGPGWTAYGGMTPGIWQYTDAQSFNGVKVDYNAFKGTVAQLRALIEGGTEMEQSDGVVGYKVPDHYAVPGGVGNVLGDLGNLRDWWYFAPGGIDSKNPPPAGSRADILFRAAQQVLAGQTATLTDAQVTALAAQVTAGVVAAHPGLTDADKPTIEAAVRDVLHAA